MADGKNSAAQGRGRVRIWPGGVLLVLVLGGLTFLVYKTGLIQFFLNQEELARFLHSLGRWGFAGFILLQALQVVVAVIPGEVTGFLGGYLYGPVLGTVLSTIGLTVGSCVAFGLSRIFGRPLMERFVNPQTIQRFDYLLHHKGAFLVFLLFLIPGFPKDYLCYILGLGRLSLLEFLAIATSGRLFGTILLTLGGSYLRAQEYQKLFTLLGLTILAAGLLIAYRDKIEQRFRRWHERSGTK